MARRKKNDADPLALLLAIPIAIFTFFKEHMEITITLGIILVVAIIAVIAAKRAKRAAYLCWYYDRDRRIEELGINDKFDVALTNAILKAQVEGTTVTIGKPNADFDNVKEAYKLAFQSAQIIHGSDSLSASDSGRALNSGFGIKANYAPLVLRYTGENNGGYVFYVFPETILAFVEGPEKVVFLAAYKPEAMKISCGGLAVPKSVVVYEKTQYDIRYYDKFSPVRDAEILSSRWEVVNKDGSRSFKGGLLPEHNPLHFKLKYGKVTFSMGHYTMDTSFSRYKPSSILALAHDNYKKTLNNSEMRKEASSNLTGNLNKVIDKKMSEAVKPEVDTSKMDAVFTSVDVKEKTEKESVAAIFTSTEKSMENESVPTVKVEQPTSIINEKPLVKKTPITVDDARYRNRMVANAICKELNHIYYGKHEFKVYQVRKDRENWKMQDAGVYTYIEDNGVQHCIELNIRTKIEDGTTNLELYIWCDNPSLTEKKYGAVINKNSMSLKGNGYNIILPNDFQGDEASMSKELIEISKVLFYDIAKL